MKTLYALLVIFMTSAVQADQRFETWQGLCHFAYDPGDDDNEVYFSNCENTIDTNDNHLGGNNVRYASGSSKVSKIYKMNRQSHPNTLSTNLKGDAVGNSSLFDGYTISPNTQCVMVTSNYNAAADDNNETVYVTNDWNLEVAVSGFNQIDQTMTYTFSLDCRKGVAQ